MSTRALAIVDAGEEHFESIVRIERASGGGSVVALTNGMALHEALERGHWVVVALDGGSVAGWAWFSVELGRSGEYVGQIFRVAVDTRVRRTGVGSGLFEHACVVFTVRQVTRIRATVPADDAAGRAFLESLGFGADALNMERPL